jgi:hypothetical protein
MGAKRFSAAEFLRLLDLWQIRYHANPGWATHNHNDRQSPLDLEFLLVHHTGDDAPDDADLRVLWYGRPDLEGPVATAGVRDDGVLELVSWGTCYHAGPGAANVLTAIQHGYVGNPPKPQADSVNGNRISMGWETMYSGKQEPTDAATATLIRLNAAICWYLKWPATRVIGHREWTGRKIDPGHLDMAEFRSKVQKAINVGPPQKAADETGDEDAMAIEREVLTYNGRAYERRGWFTQHIKTPEELHDLIDPRPKGQGIPTRPTGAEELAGYVDLDKLQRVAGDANLTAGRALQLATGQDSAVATLTAQLDELRDAVGQLQTILLQQSQQPPVQSPVQG